MTNGLGSWYNFDMKFDPAQPIATSHIELRPTRAGEPKAFIVGTRVSVENVYVCHELRGMTPDDILSAYPDLTLSQVHAALAYYYEHAEEVRSQLKRDQDYADALASRQGPTRFTELRDELQSGKDVHGDPLSSG